MRIKGLLVGSMLALLPAAALADTPAPAPAAGKDFKRMANDDCARARAQNKTCVINIEGIDVEGGTPTGTGERITTPDFGKGVSLIRIRRDFIPEIIKSAEDLP
jgi:hypothetical protein